MSVLQDQIYALLQEDPRRTVRELQALTGVKSTSTVSYNLRIPERHGLIKMETGRFRAITLVGRCPCCGR